MCDCCKGCENYKEEKYIQLELEHVHVGMKIRHAATKEEMEIVELMADYSACRWSHEKRINVMLKMKNYQNRPFYGWMPIYEFEFDSSQYKEVVE